MATKVQYPKVFSPDSFNKQWVSNQSFDFSETTYFSFKLNSSNASNKEILFGIYFKDGGGKDFGSSILGGMYEYPTKGEIGDCLTEKRRITYKSEQIDLLLDHVYPGDEQELVSNSSKSHNNVSFIFSSSRDILANLEDDYHNSYIGFNNLKDNKTREAVSDFSDYTYPAIMTFGEHSFVSDSELNILRLENITLNVTVFGGGDRIKLGYTSANGTEKIVFDEELPFSLNTESPKICFAIKSPIFSYETSAMANFDVTKVVAVGTEKS